jgi:transmembrane sensor
MEIRPDEQLLLKYLNNQCTLLEAEQVLEWMSKEEGRTLAGQFLDKELSSENLSIEMDSGNDIRSALIYHKILQKIKSNEGENKSIARRIVPKWIKYAAASIIPLLIGSALLWLLYLRQSDELSWQELQVPKGEKVQMMFQEGTRVWLNSDSKLKYPLDFRRDLREVELEGEAYFNVKSDSDKPFVVKLNNLTIKVRGTSFNVRSYSDDLAVTTTLDNGKITLISDSAGKQKEIRLLPGQEAIYSKTNKSITIQSSEPGHNSTWKNNKLVFRNTPLNELVKTLERWYNVRFVVQDPSISIYTYTISFENEKIEIVLNDLAKITPIKYRLNDGTVYLTKKNN